MIFEFDFLVLVFLIPAAIIALQLKNLVGASMVFGIYSFLMCLLWAERGLFLF